MILSGGTDSMINPMGFGGFCRLNALSTNNLDHPDPARDLNYVPNAAREWQVDCFLYNSFAFGGQNSVLVFRNTVDDH